MPFLRIFITALYPPLLCLKRVWDRKDLSFFDIYIVACTLYYILIPYKAYYIDCLPFFDLQESTTALLVATALEYVMLIVNHFTRKYTIFNLTQSIRKVDSMLSCSPRIFLLAIIFGGMMLYKVTDYSELTADNHEVNNQLYFGSNMPIYIRMFWLFALKYITIVFIFSVKVWKHQRHGFNRIFGLIAMGVIVAYYLLGPKTPMVTFIMFVSIYFYATQLHKLTRRKLLSIGGAAIMAAAIIFPFSQGLRLVKQDSVSSGSTSFSEVVSNYGNLSRSEEKALQERVAQYTHGRSTNVFDALNSSCEHPFQGNGLLSYYVLVSVLPLNTEQLGSNGNILGDVYAFKGADIGESILTWFNADLRYWGILMTAAFMIIAVWWFHTYFSFFAKYLHSRVLILYAICSLFTLCFQIEIAPGNFFHRFYVDEFLPLLVAVLAFKWTQTKSRKRLVSLQNQHDLKVDTNTTSSLIR